MLGCNDYFPAASLQTWATLEKQFTSIQRPTGHNGCHFRTFCELVEGEENKLTTFYTWTIMLGCNIIFQQHRCKLGQLWRSNGRNSQVFGQAMKKRPTGRTLWPEKEIYGRHTFVRGRRTSGSPTHNYFTRICARTRNTAVRKLTFHPSDL